MKQILSAFIISGLSLMMIQCNRQTVSSPQVVVKKTGIKFTENTSKEWEVVLAESQASGKVIFVDAYASWCGPCKYMDREIFTDERVASKFNKKFINYKVDGESFGGVNISLQYEVAAYPTYLFVNGQGQLLHKIEGIRQVEQFIEEADMALTMK